MWQVLAIAAGGAAGAVARYGLSGWLGAALGRGFPYGTLGVNVLGSLLMGFLGIVLAERLHAAPEWRMLVLVGFLGAFTTFSTFSWETWQLIEGGAWFRALLNAGLSLVLCLLAVALGIAAGRQF